MNQDQAQQNIELDLGLNCFQRPAAGHGKKVTTRLLAGIKLKVFPCSTTSDFPQILIPVSPFLNEAKYFFIPKCRPFLNLLVKPRIFQISGKYIYLNVIQFKRYHCQKMMYMYLPYYYYDVGLEDRYTRYMYTFFGQHIPKFFLTAM